MQSFLLLWKRNEDLTILGLGGYIRQGYGTPMLLYFFEFDRGGGGFVIWFLLRDSNVFLYVFEAGLNREITFLD